MDDASPSPRSTRVFVMLPLDAVDVNGVFRYATSAWFGQALSLLAATGVYGVAVDVWWGAVEREPQQYNWAGYKQLFEALKGLGLKLQVVLSFHACGGNVGDTAQVSLPPWVLRVGDQDPDLFFTDAPRENGLGQRNKEYISVWADDAPGALLGRSPMECYADFMAAFRDAFYDDLGPLIEEVVVGAGPCGELRYPSYVEANGWRFPGTGEFQCYDRRALASLAQAAREAGHPEWGYTGPHNSGNYNSTPDDTGFFAPDSGSWDTPYGEFFLGWYSGSLLQHGDRLLDAATAVFGPKLAAACGPGGGQADDVMSLCKSDSIGSDATATIASGLSAMAASLMRKPLSSSSPNMAGGQLLHASRSVAMLDGLGGCWPQSAGSAQGEGSGPDDAEAGSMLSSDTSLMALGGKFRASSSAMAVDSASCGGGSELATPSAGGGGGSLSAGGAAPGGGQQSSDFGAGRSSSGYTAAAGGAAAPGGGQQAQAMTAGSGDEALDSPQGDGGATFTSLSSAAGGPGGSWFANMLEFCCDEIRRRSAELAAGGSGGARTPPPFGAAGPSGHGGGGGGGITLTLKIAGIHWWFRSRAHAAELTAGYYNTESRDGYRPILELCARYRAHLTLTCVEMCDAQHPHAAMCSPERLLRQIRTNAARMQVSLSGENALPIFLSDGVDTVALDRIVANTQAWTLKPSLSPSPLPSPYGSAHSGWAAAAAASPQGPHCPLSPASGGGPSMNNILTASRSLLAAAGRSMAAAAAAAAAVDPRQAVVATTTAAVDVRGASAAMVADGSTALTAPMGVPQQLLPAYGEAYAHAAAAAAAAAAAGAGEVLPPMRSFTFLRLGPELLQAKVQMCWSYFMTRMLTSSSGGGSGSGSGWGF